MGRVCNDLCFLVTGVAGDIGMGIGRVLKDNYHNVSLIGVDTNSDNPALAVYDFFHMAPAANEESYENFIKSVVENYGVKILIPTSEMEISAFWALELVDYFREKAIQVIILDREIVNVSLDKLETINFLNKMKIPHPKTIAGDCFSELNNLTFPVVLKPRRGQGSKNVRVIKSMEDLKNISLSDQMIFQEYLGSDESEYTCCVVGKEGIYRVLVLHRKLHAGFTVSGKVVVNKAIESYILKIANLLKLNGSVNIQLRMTEKGPILFEINPRFSSTVVFRHKLGFKDLIWTIEGYEKSFQKKSPILEEGTKIFRGVSEYIIGANNEN